VTSLSMKMPKSRTFVEGITWSTPTRTGADGRQCLRRGVLHQRILCRYGWWTFEHSLRQTYFTAINNVKIDNCDNNVACFLETAIFGCGISE